MPGQLLFQPNPPPDPSQLPESILEYGVKLDITKTLTPEELSAIKQFRRAADYIAAGPSLPFSSLLSLELIFLYPISSDDLPQGQRPC